MVRLSRDGRRTFVSACFARSIIVFANSFNFGPPAAGPAHSNKKTSAGGTHAMMSVTRALLLAAVASVIMASVQVPVSAAAGPTGPARARSARGECQ